MKNILNQKSDYKNFISQIKQEVLESRNNVLKIVNKELVSLYFKLWKIIWDKVKKSSWWKSVVKNISEDLKKEFPGMNGFSVDNIWRIIKFSDFYSENEKLAPLAQQISWSNNVIIL